MLLLYTQLSFLYSEIDFEIYVMGKANTVVFAF